MLRMEVGDDCPPSGSRPACRPTVAVQSQICEALKVSSMYLRLLFRRVKNQFCQVISVRPVHSLKVFQLSSDVK